MGKSKTPVTPVKNRRGGTGKPIVSLDETSNEAYAYVKQVIAQLPPDVAKVLKSRKMDRDQLHRLNVALKTITSGTWSVFPLLCTGPKCPYEKRCPLAMQDIPPIGTECPIEKQNMLNVMRGYIEALEIDPDNKVEMDQLMNIAMCDIMIMRVNNQMSKKPGGHTDLVAVGMDENGNAMLRKAVSTEVLVWEKYNKIKAGYLRDLLATRESRAKYRLGAKADVGSAAAHLMSKASKALGGSVIDVEVENVIEEEDEE